MTTYPGETAEYRAARDDLLRREIELRRAMEAGHAIKAAASVNHLSLNENDIG